MNLRPLAKLTRFLVILLKVNVGLASLAVAAGIYKWIEYSNLGPEVDSSETLLDSDIANTLTGVGQFFMTILVGITFLRWIYRANKNLHALSSEPMAFTPGWAVGWYFIPFANLYKPYQAMKEIWGVAHRGAAGRDRLLGLWWLLWIASSFLGQVAFRLGLHADGARARTDSVAIDIISDVVSIALNVVAVLLITSIAKAYAANYAEQPVAAEGMAICAECAGTFSTDTMISMGPQMVCAKCKPAFIQKLTEGARLGS